MTTAMVSARRSRPGPALAALLTAFAALVAAREAQAFELGTPAQKSPYRSEQNFAVELRFSPYYPNVDDEPGLRGTPFRDRFGDSPRIYVGLELDWQFFRIPHLGTVGPGLGVGKVGMSRDARTKITKEVSADTYSLDIYPMYLSGVLRADVLWRELGFPLVPYAKIGLGAAPWSASNTGGTSKAQLPGESKAVAGEGITLGTHLAIGAAIPLDWIDSGASRNMDNAIGINGTYVYAEYYRLGLNGFGAKDALYVGTNSWAAGLAFEF